MSIERELLQEIYDDEITMMELPFSTATKLVELLAEPEPEPVAWMCDLLGNVITVKPADNNSYTPLYKSPPKRKTLSGKESEALWEAEFKSAIPVAWMYDHHIEVGHDKYTEFNIVDTCARNLESENCINVRPLYLAPPKPEPLPEPLSDELATGLTESEYLLKIQKMHGIGGEE